MTDKDKGRIVTITITDQIICDVLQKQWRLTKHF